MPDLNDPYKVLVPPWDSGERDYRGKLVEVICECESYLRRGYCRHQEEAQNAACVWSENGNEGDAFGPAIQTPEQARDHICPSCGGPTRTIIEDV